MFNLCFVFEQDVDTINHEPVVKKLASYLTQIEVSGIFLSISCEGLARFMETEKVWLNLFQIFMTPLCGTSLRFGSNISKKFQSRRISLRLGGSLHLEIVSQINKTLLDYNKQHYAKEVSFCAHISTVLVRRVKWNEQ